MPQMPQMLATFGPMISTMEGMQQMMLTTHATMSGFHNQMDELSKDSTSKGKAFDEASNDDSFYLSPEVFDNPDFQRGMKSFFSPDGKSVPMIIAHRGNPSTPEGLSRVEPIKIALSVLIWQCIVDRAALDGAGDVGHRPVRRGFG